jgi:hypothetical protein
MKYLILLFVFFFQSIAFADELGEVADWLIGKRVEKNSSCTTTLIFAKPTKISIITENSLSKGTFSISKAAGIPKGSICWDKSCYQMGYNFTEVEKRAGCSTGFEIGKHDPYLNNFHRNEHGQLIWGEDIVFVREN